MIELKYYTFLLFLILSTILISFQSIAQPEILEESAHQINQDSSIFNVLAREDILHLDIKTNFKQLIKKKRKKKK